MLQSMKVKGIKERPDNANLVAPLRWLYIQFKSRANMLASRPPRIIAAIAAITTVGMTASNKRLVCMIMIRPDGSGRHALLIESSVIESRFRWFEITTSRAP